MKKILFIAPHLSTGGLPQYLTKKIELIRNEFEVYLIEWHDVTGGVLVVTRNKLVDLVDSDKFFTLREDKSELLNIINKIKPNIIHSEEIPEYYMDDDIAQKLYNPNRDYFIVETSHDSSFDTTQKRFFPDKFMFVSNWQIQQYREIDIPKVLVEYPIEYVERPNREEALKSLGLDPNKKHILHVGLYTPRKNQSEFFEYAKSLPEYEFHSVGNQADNFKWYWEPLMENKPDNVTWWNERTDVDKFYQSMDLFLFTSRGTNNDKETMPLVIREALSYQIPQLLYNLPVYLNYFDKFKDIKYLEFDNFEKNVELIKQILTEKNQHIIPEEEAFIISTFPITQAIIDTTKRCIESVKISGRKVILTSHIPIPKELDEIVDYSINDNNNVLTRHTFYCQSWLQTHEIHVYINLKKEGNDVYHGPACYANYYNGCALAEGLGINKVYFLNYDYILEDPSYIDSISSILNLKDAYFGKDNAAEGNQITTWFLGIKPKLYLSKPKIEDGVRYDNLMHEWGAESNGLENLMYHGFKNISNLYWEEKDRFQTLCNNAFHHENYSRVEYFTVLPTDIPNYFAPFVQVSNNNDSRLIKYTLEKNNQIINQDEFIIKNKFHTYDLVKYSPEDVFKVKWDVYDLNNNQYLETKEIILDKNYFENEIKENGYLNYLNDKSKFN